MRVPLIPGLAIAKSHCDLTLEPKQSKCPERGHFIFHLLVYVYVTITKKAKEIHNNIMVLLADPHIPLSPVFHTEGRDAIMSPLQCLTSPVSCTLQLNSELALIT